MVALLLLWFLLDRPMSCPRCGDVCHCDSQLRTPQLPLKKSRFTIDSADTATVLVDPDAYEASEERFLASLDENSSSRPKFVLDSEGDTQADQRHSSAPAAVLEAPPESTNAALLEQQERTDGTAQAAVPELERHGSEPEGQALAAEACTEGTESSPAGAEAEVSHWKDEVAARLNSYRARRKPRPPKYPSLRLKFETPQPRSNSFMAAPAEPPAPVIEPPPVPVTREAHALAAAPAPEPERIQVPLPETGRIIEFPRSFYTPPARPANELAEPVVDQPRILDVPEIAPPPPALGGILLPTEEKEAEKRPGFDIPLQTPPMWQRVCAMAVDAIIVLSACALFGYIVFRIAGVIGLSLAVIETAALVLAIFWSGYQYLLLIYTGSTPGLRLARLQLSRFDGSLVPRRIRRWRVIASILAALSLGLGFAWSYLDEDALCWHDRITRTYLAPKQ